MRLEDADERQMRVNGVFENSSETKEPANSMDMDEFDDLELIAKTYRDVCEGFDDFDRAIEAVEDFIRLLKDTK